MAGISEDIGRMMIPHLRGQFARGTPVLFTGAGFSTGARNILGNPMPSTGDLRKAVWDICFPGDVPDDGSSLQDLYAQAQLRHAKELAERLRQMLSVDADTLPDYYRSILSMPWFRCYTLNIDDLELAASRKFPLPRAASAVSATGPSSLGSSGSDLTRLLEVVHLNGTLEDIPENATFSVTQYGERLARHEPWYAAVVSNLLSRPTVFIGTRLDESPLWQHLELRRMRGGRQMQELRPRSYLVTPRLEMARRALLSEFNVLWVPMGAAEFAASVLSELGDSATEGLRLLGRSHDTVPELAPSVPEVSDLAQYPMQGSEFLTGSEPIWADIQSGRAAERESDEEIYATIKERLKQDPKGLVILTGTAGSGKSTALMRASLRLTAEGTRVAWFDRDTDLSPYDIRAAMRLDGAPGILAMDDADLFGGELANLAREVSAVRQRPLILLAVRSGKIDRVL